MLIYIVSPFGICKQNLNIMIIARLFVFRREHCFKVESVENFENSDVNTKKIMQNGSSYGGLYLCRVSMQ